MTTLAPLAERMPDFAALLEEAVARGGDAAPFQTLRRAETTGRPAGNDESVAGLERLLGRPLARRAPGRKATRPPAPQAQLPLLETR